MSRLIDADKIDFNEVFGGQSDFAKDIRGAAQSLIDAQPTVEAVPVVRCINCQHWGTGVTGETEHVKCCEYAKYMVGENGYCCYGADMRTSAE